MIIIEIALGIVLAVLILRYWREIIGLGILGGVFAVGVSILLLIGYFIYENHEKIETGLVITITVLAIFVVPYIGVKFISRKISPFTLRKWNLTCGEITAFIMIISTTLTGILLLLRSKLSGEFNEVHYPIGLVLIFVGLIGVIVHFKDVKNKQNLRFKSKNA